MSISKKLQKEWDQLTKRGIRTKTTLKSGVVVSILWIWEDGNEPSIEDYSFKFTKEQKLFLKEVGLKPNEYHMWSRNCDVLLDSPEYKMVLNRIKRFISDADKYSLKKWGNKQTIWDREL